MLTWALRAGADLPNCPLAIGSLHWAGAPDALQGPRQRKKTTLLSSTTIMQVIFFSWVKLLASFLHHLPSPSSLPSQFPL